MLMDETAVWKAIGSSPFSGVVTVDVGDQRQFEWCSGFAHRALQVPIRPDTRFALASGSKTITALAVLRLVDAGLLTLDTRVASVLSDELPLVDPAVTIDQLLCHCSGIGDYLDEAADDPADFIPTVPVSSLSRTSGYLPLLADRKQVFSPGERFSYNNAGFVVLALIVERISGRGFHEVVQQEVFRPAALASAAYLRSDELPADVALGYLTEAGNRTNVLMLPVRGGGDGGCYAHAADIHCLWLALLTGRVISAELLAAMTQPRFDVPSEGMRYGLGLWLHPSGPALVMEGYDAGVSMRSIHDPLTATTATVISNTTEGAWELAEALLHRFD